MRGDSIAELVVLDASVAVRWFVREPGSEKAAELLTRNIAWLAPRLMPIEVASALRRNVTARKLRAELAVQALEALLQNARSGALNLVEDETLITGAFSLALAVNHRFPDCLYVTLAEREGASLATADHALARLAEQRKINVHFVPSA
jgi:predicted nucleic acid-binding protein